MGRALRIAAISVAALAVLGLAGWSWLTAREAVPEASDYRLELPALRRAAAELPGPRPVALHSALVAEASLPRGALFAGEPLEPHPMVHQVFQVLYPDGRFLLVDTGFSEEAMARMGEGRFEPAARDAVRAAYPRAEAIVVTHEHFDHLAGVGGDVPAADVAGRLRLTREQLANASALEEAGLRPETLQGVVSLDYDETLALAPGVALRKAPGHTPGSQLVFVTLADGREVLLVGDVAWHLDQIRALHYRPRLVTDFFLGEDRGAVLDQFRTLHDTLAAEPALVILVSHDRDQRERLLASGVLQEGLATSSPGAGRAAEAPVEAPSNENAPPAGG